MSPVVAFDTETSLIRPARLAPDLVVATWQSPGQPAGIEHVSTVEPRLRAWLESGCQIVGHNVAYDLAVVAERFPALRPLIFQAYAQDRVTDTMIRQWLLDVAGGVYRGRPGEKGRWITHNYGLEDLARRLTDIRLLKDGWRMSYAEFLDTPLEAWPARAREVQEAARPRVLELEALIAGAPKKDDRIKAWTKERDGLQEMIDGDPTRASEYPLDDARATLAVYLAQEVHARYLSDQYRQARAYWALHLSSAWGLRTDELGVERLRATTQAAYDELEDDLVLAGLVRTDRARTRDTKAAKARMIRVCHDEGIALRRTDAHAADLPISESKCKDAEGNTLPPGHDACAEHVSLDGDACDATDDELLKAYSEISTLKKVLSNDVEAMLRGIEYPVHTRYGFAETGRTTSSKPAIQNVGKREGTRECYVPRPGYVFAAADYPALEMFTLAQCCVTWLGQSKLAEALNGGLDPHLAMAAEILGRSYEETKAKHDAGDKEVDDVRQLSKVANFGFPGGMGPPKLLVSAKKQLKPEVVARLGLDVERMKELKGQWFRTWPEMPLYFSRVNALVDTPDGRAFLESIATKRFRGGASYCAAANSGFQGLGSDCAKAAAWQIALEQYETPSSALYNTRGGFFVHDEFGIEVLEEHAHEAALRLADVMVEAANFYLPDVPIPRAKVKPVLMFRWSKKAKPVFDLEGRLVPWVAS
jgi:DNA polymerase-1